MDDLISRQAAIDALMVAINDVGILDGDDIYKCMCFQCGKRDCEHYESEPPEWVKDFIENEEIKEKLKRISKSRK